MFSVSSFCISAGQIHYVFRIFQLLLWIIKPVKSGLWDSLWDQLLSVSSFIHIEDEVCVGTDKLKRSSQLVRSSITRLRAETNPH